MNGWRKRPGVFSFGALHSLWKVILFFQSQKIFNASKCFTLNLPVKGYKKFNANEIGKMERNQTLNKFKQFWVLKEARSLGFG